MSYWAVERTDRGVVVAPTPTAPPIHAHRGPEKFMFASAHPLLELDKCAADLGQLELPPEITEAYAAGNADRVFFSASRQPGVGRHTSAT